MNPNLRKQEWECDLCVVGGGLAGSFAALAAARRGFSVILMQDRPMLGGNASSEIRMWVRGARNLFDRETGYISEWEEKNIRLNPTLVPSLNDATLYGMLAENKNIRLLMNTSCCDAVCDGERILSVTGWQMTTYTWHTVRAKLFADCSGDSILAPMTGARYRVGREAKEEFGETLAQETADPCTMGMSVILAARETDHPVPFTPPPFARIFPTDASFSGNENITGFDQVRSHRPATSGDNLWWVELGGVMDTIHDADRVREELLANIYGVWDHIKNRGDHGMENWDLDFVGFLPGKRESRRYVGALTVCEKDIVSGGHFDDEIAYGGWPLDDHNPLGMDNSGQDKTASRMIPVSEAYGLPFRALYSENIGNLLFAGRNISVTHVALSSTRVMATCALLGQAAGTGAAVALRHGILPAGIYPAHIREVQKELMDDGVFLPHFPRPVSALTAEGISSLPEAEWNCLRNGMERPRSDSEDNGIRMAIGSRLTVRWNEPKSIGAIRLRFDPDFHRMSISDNPKMRVFAMKLHTGKDFVPVRVADTIVRDFHIEADGETAAVIRDNYLSLVCVPVGRQAKEISVVWDKTNGAADVHLFSVDFL